MKKRILSSNSYGCKNKRILCLPFYLLIFILFLGCKKEVDFRDKYIGNYDFTIHEHLVNPIDSTVFDTNIFYSGQIIKSSSGPDILEISYLSNSSMLATLWDDGSISDNINWPNGLSLSGKFEGNNKLKFDLVFLSNGYEHVEGVKY